MTKVIGSTKTPKLAVASSARPNSAPVPIHAAFATRSPISWWEEAVCNVPFACSTGKPRLCEFLFHLGSDLEVGQSIVVNRHPQLITSVEPEILGIVVAYCGTEALLIHPDEAVELAA